jgi:dTDP-4-dehydrorhamnose reductase
MQKQGIKTINTYNSATPLTMENAEHFNALGENTNKRLKEILNKYRPSAIINTIAYVTVDGCELHPDLAQKLNVEFVGQLVSALKEVGLNQTSLVHISSDSVYGNRKGGESDSPWKETDLISPLSVYAQTKYLGELEALKHSGTKTVLRTAFYGINPYSSKSLLYWIIENAKEGNSLEGWENIFFGPISATELARSIIQILKLDIGGIYNIGSSDICNKYDFVNAVCENLHFKNQVNRISKTSHGDGAHSIRPNYSFLDSSKLASLTKLDIKWRADLATYMNNLNKTQG